MERIALDTGLVELEVNGRHILRINPSDPHVYTRCMEMCRELPELAGSLKDIALSGGEESPEEARDRTMAGLKALDAKIKERLSYVFGRQNDFDAILDGASVLSVAANGHTVLENLLNSLTPVLEAGLAKRHELMRGKAAEAVAGASRRRASRRGSKRGDA